MTKEEISEKVYYHVVQGSRYRMRGTRRDFWMLLQRLREKKNGRFTRSVLWMNRHILL